MRLLVFSAHPWDREFLDAAFFGSEHRIEYVQPHLDRGTARIAVGSEAVCVFVNDTLDSETLQLLAGAGTRLVLLRCAGYNNVDLAAAQRLGIEVMRVPAYSPNAVAEHAVALMLTLNRKVHRAWNRTREGNFSLDGLLGFDMAGATVGVVGTGSIGRIVARILRGFGSEVICCDPIRDPRWATSIGVSYAELGDLLACSRIVTLHCPLTPETFHLIDAAAIGRMQRGAMLINTSRGAVVDARALVDAIKAEHLGAVGLDVYEEEADIFFEDVSMQVIRDDVLARLTTFPNVVITGHQAFFTSEALDQIARATRANLESWIAGTPIDANRVCPGPRFVSATAGGRGDGTQ